MVVTLRTAMLRYVELDLYSSVDLELPYKLTGSKTYLLSLHGHIFI